MLERQFHMEGTVRRVVIDTVALTLLATDSNSAADKAREVLASYPGEHYIPGVSYAFIENRENGEVDVVNVRERTAVDQDT